MTDRADLRALQKGFQAKPAVPPAPPLADDVAGVVADLRKPWSIVENCRLQMGIAADLIERLARELDVANDMIDGTGRELRESIEIQADSIIRAEKAEADLAEERAASEGAMMIITQQEADITALRKALSEANLEAGREKGRADMEALLREKAEAEVRQLREVIKGAEKTMTLLLAVCQKFEAQASKGIGGRRGGPVFERSRACIANLRAALTLKGDDHE